MFIITSYYTKNTPYENVANEYLIPSLEKIDCKRLVKGVENLGSWQLNTSYKPKFILEMLVQNPGVDVVFVDCDAKITSYPRLFDEIPSEYYFAAHILDRQQWYRREYSNNDRFELLSGTVWFRNCDESKKLIQEWIKQTENSKIWEQRVLYDIVKKNLIPISFLPISYCWIVSLPNGDLPFVKCDKPIIEHYQKSRELKQIIK